MAQLDPSNPVAVITAFFATMFTAIFFILRIVQIFAIAGMFAGSLFALVIGLVWFKTFTGNEEGIGFK